MNHFRLRLVVLITAVTATLPFTTGSAQAATHTYYVSTTGSDTNPGTQASPYKTVGRCATVATPGDTCVITTGVYHETLTPANSGTANARITYTASPGARVTLDGADPVTGWQPVTSTDLAVLQAGDPFISGSGFATAVNGGHVYAANVVLNPSLPGNQLFVDGAVQAQAQWPEPGPNPTVPHLASAQSGTTTSLSDAALTQPTGFWVGARLTAHNWFVSETGTVTSSTVGSVTGANLPTCVGLSPNQSTNYSLSGKIELLDHPGEWFYQASSHKLYLWTPDSADPSAHTIEAKQRNVAIDLSGKSDISVLGIGIRAATAQTSATSTRDILDGINAQQVSSYDDLNPDPNMVTSPDGCAVLTAGETTSGVQLAGTANTLRNSVIDGSTGNGVVVSGSGNTVTNNTILHTDTLGSYAAGVNLLGSNQVITHNTIESAGRSDINIDNKVAGATASGHTIAYNDLSDYDNLVVDGGAIYVCCAVDLAGTVIHHNQFHDPAPFAASAPAPGVYLDLGTFDATIYDNVAWNKTTWGAVLFNPGGATTSGNKIYNNTSGTDTNVASTFGGTYTTTDIVNNIGVTGTDSGINNTNNFTPVSAAQYTNPAADDFTLKSTSPARNAGVVWSPATDGFTDAHPSLGAYQYGSPKWIAGSARSGTKTQAESYSSSSGVSPHAAGTGTVVGSIDGGDWFGYTGVNFGANSDLFTAYVGVDDPYAGKGIEIHIDSVTGPTIGVLYPAATGGFDTLSIQSTSITPTSGTHNVFFVAPGSAPGFGNIDYFTFTQPSCCPGNPPTLQLNNIS
ncbi:sugar hydrolase [Kutzneria sp. CA-103260]|nr:sugar hydrolase [Kutzneria sp. CA-103260]